MRRLIAVWASSLLCSTFLFASVPDTTRLIIIANSFGEDAVENNLHEIALADGHVLVTANMFIGGCYLEKHWNNAVRDSAAYSYRKVDADGHFSKRPATSLDHALRDEPWDIVVFHQSSGLSGIASSYEPYLTNLLKYVKARVPKGARMMMNQTWAYAGGATNKFFANYDWDQQKMYDALCSAYSEAALRHNMQLIPSGTAVQNSRSTSNWDNVTRDGYHMHRWFGRYLVACTFYEAIYGKSVVGNSYVPQNLMPYRIELAQKCAHAACLKPLEVSQIEEKEMYFNADPKAIAPYDLPDALTMADGRKVTSAEQWYSERRPELLELFETQMYGKAPGKIEGTTFEVVEEDRNALGGKAVRKQIKIDFNKGGQYVMVLEYLPKSVRKAPVFLSINFKGNAASVCDTAVLYPEIKHAKKYGVYTESPRGFQASRWPVEELVDRGYGVVMFHYFDIDPDFDDGFGNGVIPFIYKEGQKYPEPDQWGNISAWAWGMSRVMDYLQTDPDVDASRVAVVGHSRLGKTALLAGARDERFALVISNDSGCCGAALSRRKVGETVEVITHHFPHWFCGNFFKYGDNEEMLPFDQHELLALVAPRPVYVASAEQDGWADPVGEQLSVIEARKVYEFLGLDPAMAGYHIREGKHDINLIDWNHYMDFADRYMR